MAIEIKNNQGKVLHVFEGDTLKGADLYGLDLSRAFLRKEFLRGAIFVRANLYGADFQGADLTAADFLGASLMFADLRNAILQKARFHKAMLTNVNFQGTDLRGLDFRSADLGKADFRDAFLQGVDCQGVFLQGANLSGANLEGTHFMRADVQKAKFIGANLANANFTGAKLKGANFTGAKNIDKAIGLEGITTGRQASQLEQEWGPLVKTARGGVPEGALDIAKEIVGKLKASPYVDTAYITDSWELTIGIVWVKVEIRPKIQDDARPGANTLRLKSEISKLVSRYRLRTDTFLSPKQNWAYKPDEFDPRALINFYKKHPYIWEFRYRFE